MTPTERQRIRRARLKASGSTCRLQSELSSTAALALIHLSTVREQSARAVLEDLITKEVEHGAA
ncbi:hypothetical protein [Acidithiobacillus ferridurans]|jgi:hypothetical protein|uniref:hypothetical protein n=1 Tax=Acidithiobacillus ferridurans TaxID=1232575 RepID=UPI001C077EE6|nr:hypothetical protein [Acidithiobacillus ferridurans]MBU2734103.1 hypothetical protein [Acidithiobacillus ferridurans]